MKEYLSFIYRIVTNIVFFVTALFINNIVHFPIFEKHYIKYLIMFKKENNNKK